MRIGIDARWIFPQISGIGAYTRELIRNLLQIDGRNEYFVFYHEAAGVWPAVARELGIDGCANLRSVPLSYGVFSLRNQLLLPLKIRGLGLDLFHSTNYMIPFAAFRRRGGNRTRCVATVHDVIPLLFRDSAPRSRKARLFWLYRALMLRVGRCCDLLITDSAASRRDVLRELQIGPDAAGAVLTVYCGVSERFVPSASRAAWLGGGAAPLSGSGVSGRRRRLLYVGRLDPYKNVELLVRVVALLGERGGLDVELVIAGPPDPRYPGPGLLAGQLGVSERVRWLGYLSDSELVAVYQEADVLVHASRYEGFGLQVVEAMACGLPVVCTDCGSLAEVAGDAALTAGPDDEAGFAAAVERLLTDPAAALACARRGVARAGQFTWRRAAESTLRAYESLCESVGDGL